MAKNQNTVVNPTRMDSRKFLASINESVDAKKALFESKISEMGSSIGKNWKLASFRLKQINRDQQYGGDLFIEDVDTNDYYKADFRREKGGRVVIENIVKIEIIEEEKQSLFESSCLQLIDAIESNNQNGMSSAFDKIASQRFSGKIIPEHGIVRTRDGVARKIKVSGGQAVSAEAKEKIVQYIVESLNNKVIVEHGGTLSCSFNDGKPIKLPVTKWASKKLIGKHMKEAAKEAYKSTGFQNRIYETAQLIYDNKIEEAIKLVGPFLKENEEFTLLKRSEIDTLVGNALATKACFNEDLAKNTASLLYKTNLKVNKNTIVREWRKIAIASEHATLLENVDKLSGASDFNGAYDRFLEMIFEAISNREVTAEALATTLDVLKNRTPRIKESHDLSSRLNDLITRLREPAFDDASIYEAEDLIATIQEELSANENLKDFDAIPGDDNFAKDIDMGNDDASEDLDLGGDDHEDKPPQIVINSPLIQIGGTSGGGGEDDFAGDDLDIDDDEGIDDTGEFDLGEGGGPDMLQGGAGGGQTGNAEFGNDEGLGESFDPYAFKQTKARQMFDYGKPVITDKKILTKIITMMGRLAEENDINGSTINENLTELSKAAIEAVGVTIPANKAFFAIEQVSKAFMESGKPWENDDDEDEDCDDGSCDNDAEFGNEGVVEDQYKSPKIKKAGYKRSSINKLSEKLTSEDIQWTTRQKDGVAGTANGVNFILDHGIPSANVDAIVMNESGDISVPVPKMLRKSALAAAGVTKADAQPFCDWLSENLEQLAPLTEEDRALLDEAVATITASSDGTISVSVDGDVNVDSDGDQVITEPEDEMMGGEEPFGGDLEGEDELGIEGDELEGDVESLEDDEEAIEGDVADVEGDIEGVEGDMKPVDTVNPIEDDSEESEMPDFDDEDDGLAEDRDMTDPSNKKYTSHADEDKRSDPAKSKVDGSREELEGIGTSPKQDDGTGTKHKPAGKKNK
jgi:hypothetical protein